jgi:hypothetical protein
VLSQYNARLLAATTIVRAIGAIRGIWLPIIELPALAGRAPSPVWLSDLFLLSEQSNIQARIAVDFCLTGQIFG